MELQENFNYRIYMQVIYIQTSINISYSAHSVEGVEMISATQIYRKSVAEIWE